MSFENLFLPFLYILTPFFSVIIPISFLIGTILTFSRLNENGELTALIANGFTLKQIIGPVLALSLLFTVATSFCASHLEGWGRRNFIGYIFEKTQTELDNLLNYRIQPKTFTQGFLDYVFYAEDLNKDRSKFKNVLLSPGRKTKSKDFVLLAPEAQIQGSIKEGNLIMDFSNGMLVSYAEDRTIISNFKKASVDLIALFQEKFISSDTLRLDYRSLSFSQIKDKLNDMQLLQKTSTKEYKQILHLFLARMANPLLIIAFAIIGSLISIGSQRSSKNLGYLYLILACISCFALIEGFRWLAFKEHIETIAAVVAPHILILSFALYFFYRRLKTPLHESLWAYGSKLKLYQKTTEKKSKALETN